MKIRFLFLVKRVLILVILFYLSSNLLIGQTIKGSWKSIANLPTARWFPGTAVCDGKIYVIGGNATSSTAPLNVVEVYNPATDKWETKTPMPVPRSQLSACTVNGKIYVIGGSSGPTGWKPVPDVAIYDPSNDTWSTGTDMPSPRTELALVAAGDKIYAIGGIDGSSAASKSVDVYDPATNSWSKGADLITARGTEPACVLDGKIYVFGGSNGGVSSWNHFSSLEVYDIAGNSWTAKAEMPFSHSHLTGCVLDNKIFALGGSQVNTNKSFADMASYNPLTDTWENEPSMLSAREAFCSVVVNGKIYAIGGTQMQLGLTAFSNSEVYDPTPNVFISDPEMRLPAKQASLIGKLFVPNSGNLKFTYQKEDNLNDGSLFLIRNDSVVAAQNFGLDAKKEYQFEILAISENGDSVKSLIKLKTYFKVDAVFNSPMGFLLKSSDKKVMLDVCSSRSTSYGFIINSDTICQTIKKGAAPYDNVDLIFTSHPHTCHFDADILFNSMKSNPRAISVMNPDVKTAMNSYFTSNPEMLKQVFAPVIPLNSSIDTTLAGIKIRLTSIAHEGATMLTINVLLDSIRFLLFDDYNNLSLATYKTIGFNKIPTDVAIIGSLLLDGGQEVIKQTFTPANYLNVCHIESYSAQRYSACVTNAEKLKALNYQISVLNQPMQMFSYKKSDNRINTTTLNSAPQLSRTYKDMEVEKYDTVKVYVPKTTFKDPDTDDVLDYSFSISTKPLPEWATFDNVKQTLVLTPTAAKTSIVTITATDNHLSFASVSFKLKVTVPAGVENMVKNSDFKVYPNPSHSLINVEGPESNQGGFSVQLFNLTGEKIYSGDQYRDNKTEIDLTRFSESVMFMVITSDGKNECHKIVKY
jgi:N-acetylneuraminic acid mutarotase